MERTWTFVVGRVPLSLVGPDDWIGRFARTWAAWSAERGGWEVHLSQDANLPAPGQPYTTARPRFAGGRCSLLAPGFAGEIAPAEKRAQLQAHPSASPGDLAYFVRTAFALSAFEQGALLFHAAGIVHNGSAYAFFGRSGSGKTTAARLSVDKPVLSDDLLLLRRSRGTWEAWATPFGQRRGLHVHSAPLRALFRLSQATEEKLEPMSRARALGEVIAGVPVINADPARAEALLARCEDVLDAEPVALLRFRKSNSFWKVIDAYLD